MTQPRPKPKSKQPKYQVEKLETASNSRGEIFNAGDLIQVQDLKSRPTTAKIKGLNGYDVYPLPFIRKLSV